MRTQEEAQAELRELVGKSMLYLVSRHRTASREYFDAFVIVLHPDAIDVPSIDMRRVTNLVSQACERFTYDRKHEAFRVGNPGYRRSLYVSETLRELLGIAVPVDVL